MTTNLRRPTLRAFTLIELMLVVAIIGIIAAIAIPGFIRFSCRAKQAEAKAALKQILVAEESYRAEFDTYVDGPLADLKIIGFVVAGTSRRYDYRVPTATASTFDSIADGLPANTQTGDIWQGTQDNVVENTTNICLSL